jgi:DNA polymerase I
LKRPLLVVDGDSFAHRAFHALPSSIRRAEGRPAGALTGFVNMVLRLWESERPRAVLVAWDTLEVPTYRHEAFAGYQAGREFAPELLEQLDLLPRVVEAFGFVYAKAPGYEADDFLAAAVAAQEEKGEPTLVATSDRDAFQLASERTTILMPVRGVHELARVGPADVRERYGVEPEQVPDFIALRGDSSDRIPGAPGVGAKRAAEILRQHGSLEDALAAGRFSRCAEELRLYRRIATLDASAPLPSLRDNSPQWAEASAFLKELGLNRLSERVAALQPSTS